jgi:TfoX/Sxy family transcriptional regulator of competence genes
VAFDDALAQRIRSALAQADPATTERRMFGGLAFLQRGLMVVGVSGDTLMARVGPAQHADSLARPHVRPMDFTGRPMNGYVYVDPPGLQSAAELRFWLDRSRHFVATLPAKLPKPGKR